jgi:hypothetical protein
MEQQIPSWVVLVVVTRTHDHAPIPNLGSGSDRSWPRPSLNRRRGPRAASGSQSCGRQIPPSRARSDRVGSGDRYGCDRRRPSPGSRRGLRVKFVGLRDDKDPRKVVKEVGSSRSCRT